MGDSTRGALAEVAVDPNLWAPRLTIGTDRLAELIGGAPPAERQESVALVRLVLAVVPAGANRDAALAELVSEPSQPAEPETDLVARSAAKVGLSPAELLETVGDRLWHEAILAGGDPESTAEHVAAVTAAQAPALVQLRPEFQELRQLYLTREQLALGLLPASDLAPAHVQLGTRELELRAELAEGLTIRGTRHEESTARQLAIAFGNVRACAALSAKDLDRLLQQPRGWFNTVQTGKALDPNRTNVLQQVLELPRVAVLPSWVRDDAAKALKRYKVAAVDLQLANTVASIHRDRERDRGGVAPARREFLPGHQRFSYLDQARKRLKGRLSAELELLDARIAARRDAMLTEAAKLARQRRDAQIVDGDDARADVGAKLAAALIAGTEGRDIESLASRAGVSKRLLNKAIDGLAGDDSKVLTTLMKVAPLLDEDTASAVAELTASLPGRAGPPLPVTEVPMLDGRALAERLGGLLSAARNDLGMEADEVADLVGLSARAVRMREEGAGFKTFRGFSNTRKIAAAYRQRRDNEEITQALSWYSDLLLTREFNKYRHRRDDLDDRTIMLAVMVGSACSQRGVTEQALSAQTGIPLEDLRRLTRPQRNYDESDQGTLVKLGQWLRSPTDSSPEAAPDAAAEVQPRPRRDRAAVEWPQLPVAQVQEFSELRQGLGFGDDPEQVLRGLVPVSRQAPRSPATTRTPIPAPAPPTTPRPAAKPRSGSGGNSRVSTVRPTGDKPRSTSRPATAKPTKAAAAPGPAPSTSGDSELWWEVAALARLRFGLPLTHEVSAAEVAQTTISAADAPTLRLLANGAGHNLSREQLDALRGAAGTQMPGASDVAAKKWHIAAKTWPRPIGQSTDPAVMYAVLLAGWAAQHGITRSRLVGMEQPNLKLPRGTQLGAPMLAFARGHALDAANTRIRRKLTRSLLGLDVKAEIDFAELFSGQVAEREVVPAQQVQQLAHEPGPVPAPVPTGMTVAAEASTLAGADVRIIVIFDGVPIEVERDQLLRTSSADTGAHSAARKVMRRQHLDVSRHQDTTVVAGSGRFADVFDEELVDDDPAVSRWRLQTRTWYSRNNTKVLLTTAEPDADLPPNFELIVRRDGEYEAIEFRGSTAWPVPEPDRVARMAAFALNLAQAESGRGDVEQSSNLDASATTSPLTSDQAARDARLRVWFMGLSDDEVDELYQALPATGFGDVTRYLLDGDAMNDQPGGRLRRSVRAFQVQNSPNALELDPDGAAAIFRRRREHEGRPVAAAAALIEDAIAEVDDDEVRAALQAVVVHGELAGSYGEQTHRAAKTVNRLVVNGLETVRALLGWKSGADIAAIEAAVAGNPQIAGPVAERKLSKRAQQRLHVAAALRALDPADVAPEVWHTAQLLTEHPDETLAEVGARHEPPIGPRVVSQRQLVLLTAAEQAQSTAQGRQPPGTPSAGLA